jgi:protein phosphatase
LRDAVTAANLWAELGTDWLALDCELMPWSAKAQELLQTQYAAVGAVASQTLRDAVALLRQTEARLGESIPLAARYVTRADKTAQYIAAYRRYCWNVVSLDDLRLAPFHILASEGAYTSISLISGIWSRQQSCAQTLTRSFRKHNIGSSM